MFDTTRGPGILPTNKFIYDLVNRPDALAAASRAKEAADSDKPPPPPVKVAAVLKQAKCYDCMHPPPDAAGNPVVVEEKDAASATHECMLEDCRRNFCVKHSNMHTVTAGPSHTPVHHVFCVHDVSFPLALSVF